MLTTLSKKGHEIVAVIGGGQLAREFITAAKDMGLDEPAQDEIAISVSRLFAELFVKKLGKAGHAEVITSLEEVIQALPEGKIIIMGGLKPGLTTDAVAAMVAERVKANLLVKGTDQEGVYDKDPRKHIDAIKLDHLSLIDLCKVFEESKHKAGIHQIVDPVAIDVLKRYRVKLIIVNGYYPENISAAINGERIGTVIE
jgi:uridylate kinase